jgi:hypothetical protein
MYRKHVVPLALSVALLGFVAAPVAAQQSGAQQPSLSGSGNSVIPEKVDRLPDNSVPPSDENSLERGQSPGMDASDPDLNSDELCEGAVAPDDKQRCDAGVNPPAATDGPNGTNPETNGTGANGGPRL